ncbi:MAG: ATP-dependent helicase HrpB [Desulfovibrionaceae bacterium]|nr:ATP-dependent helicase HrpB [Desulfovibrionaceae bacterium]
MPDASPPLPPAAASPPPLPVDKVLPDLVAALRANTRALLTAPPGSGKTTRVPPALAAAGPLAWGKGKVLVLEPRRLTARAAARWTARLLDGEVGGKAGYSVRLESRVSSRTVVEFVTEGVLTRRLLADPGLSGVACVIFDEFHERSLQADLGLALCLEAQELLRPDLRLLIMSATLDAAPLLALLGNCPVLRSEGRLWPVDLRYLPPPPGAGNPGLQDPVPAVTRAARLALAEERGSLLVFLPGAGEIRRAAEALAGLPPGVCVHPLYGDLPAAAQDAAIAPAPPGQRKIVLATSIAESSLTIEGVRVVIDAGLTRTMRFDPATDLDGLVTGRVTRDRADQRAGRAGRTEPGVCFRLWDEREKLPDHARPEMLDADLAPLVLAALSWGTPPEHLAWLTPPPDAALARARRTLELLGALRHAGPDRGTSTLTPLGEALARLPLHPRLGRMLLKAGEHAALAAAVAAIVSGRDPLRGQRAGVDLRWRIDCLRADHGRLRRSAEQIYAAAGYRPPLRLPDRADDDRTGSLIGLAWPERLAQRRARGSFRLASGRGVNIPPDDPLADEPWLAVAALDAATGRVFLAAPVRREDLERDHGPRILREETLRWDPREQAVLARRRTRLDALILDDAPLPPREYSENYADAVLSAVLEGVRSLGLMCLPWTEDLRQWQARVLFLRGLEPERGWPDVSDAALLDGLEGWLPPWLRGISRRAQFGGLDLGRALNSLLPAPLPRRLAEQAPGRLPLPSGSSAAVDYTAQGGPVLAVKLQEMFGQAETPRIAGGRVPLTLHLLSPAGRPLQVTRDLAGFWRGGYPAVRAEMRGRYPRHPWPDDPLTAAPTGRTKKRTHKP